MSEDVVTFAAPNKVFYLRGIRVDVIRDADWPFTGQNYVFIRDPDYGPQESGLREWIPKDPD